MKYFVVRDFDSDVRAVVRTGIGGEQIHVGPAGWVRSVMLRYLELTRTPGWARQVTEEEAEAVIAARPARRCFLVWSAEPSHVPFAVVRLDGEREEAYTRELAWGPSDLLAGVAGRSELQVQEQLPTSSNTEAYLLALRYREHLQEHVWKGILYHAIFHDTGQALDLANVVRLVKRDTWKEYEYYGGDEWRPIEWLRSISTGGSAYEHLPISPDEARRLMAHLDEQRLRDDPRR
ncbi:hypothetical protein JNUCC0626_18690 [Lentzea sp. JNUCC 0626]|uniref:hypothetical protein n=1 Tax=Lentzea sp. JNUCC 0626 TaxID=3367513 RepID=UPI00374832C9